MSALTPNPRLTTMAAGGGCACKLPAPDLERLVGDALQQTPGDQLLVGVQAKDDAAVIRLNGDVAVISTADFFTPVVDNPYDWGRIAAANALSDVYAMGGEPLTAINLLCWPGGLDLDIASSVIKGGQSICAEAGIEISGGHTINDREPKYGLAVTGTAHPDRLLRIDQADPGQALTLTKPLGIGIMSNLHQRTGERVDEAIEVMTQLNRDASRLALAHGLRSATDVTGFGLLGHAFKMARASNVTLTIETRAVPVLNRARAALTNGYLPGGSLRNHSWVRPHLRSHVAECTELLLADAQTSGGLLVAGALPGYPVIGEIREFDGSYLVLR